MKSSQNLLCSCHPLSTKKQITKLTSAKFRKCILLNIENSKNGGHTE